MIIFKESVCWGRRQMFTGFKKKTLVWTWSLIKILYIKDAILLNNAWIFLLFWQIYLLSLFSRIISYFHSSWYWNLWVRLIGPSVEGVLGLEPKVTTYFVTSIMLGNLSLTHALFFFRHVHCTYFIISLMFSLVCSRLKWRTIP